ncbi:fibronectin type III domain-containing protein [Candidatus Daviesbacteria bacterium]|nr:fibronectin type III domain-containing protein [Candidatus Daviesbacteria bacterium]
MGSEIKIPTILGLAVLIVGLGVGVFLTVQRQIFTSKAALSSTPKNITVANLSGHTASVYWQTDEAVTGFIQAGENSSLGQTFKDDRDIDNPVPHQVHFVTLANLKPNTIYYYKIISGSSTFPESELLNFKTPALVSPLDQKPIIGTLLGSDKKPITEALILLAVPGGQNLATVTKLEGNFILPLTELKNTDLGSSYNLSQNNPTALLTIFNNQAISKISLKLPFDKILPPITLGQNLDLSSPQATVSAGSSKFDLNHDGVVNLIDRSILMQAIGKKPTNNAADFNGDGVVDQKDLNLIDAVISNQSR